MDNRSKRIMDILKKAPGDIMCIDTHSNKLYILVDGEFLLTFVGRDFLSMSDEELKRFVFAMLSE